MERGGTDTAHPARRSRTRPPRVDGPAPPTCAICLRGCKSKSSTNSCMHPFCFKCLLEWSKVKAECPLCKQSFNTIMHASTTVTNPNAELLQVKEVPEPGNLLEVYRQETIRGETRTGCVSQLWRRHVYDKKLYALPLPDERGRLRECSAEFYRKHPQQMDRLYPFINRDVVCLLRGTEISIDMVNEEIRSKLTVWNIASGEFRREIMPYLGRRTMHFIHELNNFARSHHNIEDYDDTVQYLTSNVGDVFQFSTDDSTSESEPELENMVRNPPAPVRVDMATQSSPTMNSPRDLRGNWIARYPEPRLEDLVSIGRPFPDMSIVTLNEPAATPTVETTSTLEEGSEVQILMDLSLENFAAPPVPVEYFMTEPPEEAPAPNQSGTRSDITFNSSVPSFICCPSPEPPDSQTPDRLSIHLANTSLSPTWSYIRIVRKRKTPDPTRDDRKSRRCTSGEPSTSTTSRRSHSSPGSDTVSSSSNAQANDVGPRFNCFLVKEDLSSSIPRRADNTRPDGDATCSEHHRGDRSHDDSD